MWGFLLGTVVGGSVVISLLALLLGSARRGSPLKSTIVESIENQAMKAVRTQDVPCGAVLIYDGEIIGSGSNEVNHSTDGGAHAEIVAISDAMRRLGHEAFGELDREKLLLVTSWEPCAMCRGAALVHRIHHVHFATKKPLREVIRERAWEIRHFLRRRQRAPHDLQDRLMAAYYEVHGRPGQEE